MPHDRQTVDALLATAVSRLLNAAAVLNQMRELHRQDRDVEFWSAALGLGAHLTIGGHCIIEAQRLMLADIPTITLPPEGGLPN